MRIEPVDERNSCWESTSPRFRVYRYRLDHLAQSWTTATDDITESDAFEVIDWARQQAGGDQLYAVALVVDDRARPEGGQRGLVWLVGDDLPNADPSDLSEVERHRLAEMFRRRDDYAAVAGG